MTKKNYFIEIAKLSSLLSTCSRLKVGCVLVDKDNKIISTGYNGVLSKLPHCNVTNKDMKTPCDCIHAEMNAILRIGDKKPIVCYVTSSPCLNCAKALSVIGIKKIIYINKYRDFNRVKEYLDFTKIKIESFENV